MNTAVEYDTTVTKSQIAGLLRKANIVRYSTVAGGKSTLRDVTRKHAHYSGIEVIENATQFNVARRDSRPRWKKVTTGKFEVIFTHGYNGQRFSQKEANEILNQAVAALVANGFVIVSENFRGYTVAKVGA